MRLSLCSGTTGRPATVKNRFFSNFWNENESGKTLKIDYSSEHEKILGKAVFIDQHDFVPPQFARRERIRVVPDTTLTFFSYRFVRNRKIARNPTVPGTILIAKVPEGKSLVLKFNCKNATYTRSDLEQNNLRIPNLVDKSLWGQITRPRSDPSHPVEHRLGVFLALPCIREC
jgi:hypothetical protein